MSKGIWAVFGSTLLIVLATGAGCGQKSSGPKTYPVTGTVTLRGQPVEGAMVTFRAAGGQSAVGTTDAAGRYLLTAGAAGRGAVAGQYQVAIVKFKAAEAAPAAKAGGDYVPPDPSQPPPPAPENLLPAKYADPKTSGLTADVKDGGSSNFDFNLE